jgi:anthranilate phosphoribosyltransferase
VLAALGVKIDLPPARVGECIDEVGIGFLFAPLFHGAMKHCASVRQELAVRTLLNILGPLSNPAGATMQVVGVYDHHLTELMAKVLMRLGTQHCFVVHGMDGLDEVTLTERTWISEGKAGVVSSYVLDPKDFGLERARLKDVCGGTIDENARIIREILQGRSGPKRDIVCLNAGLALVASRRAKTVRDGFELAGEAINSGAASERLQRLIEFTNRR